MKTIFTFSKLYRAYLDCRKNKRKTMSALRFEKDFERNLFSLQKELKERTYNPEKSICFAVKKPCPREIFASTFKDRVIHHLLINEIIKEGEKTFIFDSFSCRKNKGTHFAIHRLRRFIRKVTENGNKNAYYSQVDISGFFMSIDRNILYSIFEKFILKQKKKDVWEENILWLGKKIIFYDPTKNYLIKGNPAIFSYIPKRKSLFSQPCGIGIPIGNYSSQFFSNLYLNELDQFVKRDLKCKYYIRYVDDFVLLSKNKRELKIWQDKIENFLKTKLGLELNYKKTKIRPINMGISFLGYFVKTNYLLVRRNVISQLKENIYNLKKADKLPKVEKILAIINSYYGHFNHAFSFNMRKKIYKKNLDLFKNKLSFKDSSCRFLVINSKK